jgi:hypothetical protein
MVHGILKQDEDLVSHLMTNLSNSSLFGALIGVWKMAGLSHQFSYVWKSGGILTPIFLISLCVCFDHT